MRNPTDYLKMRVLGAIDMAEGNTQRERIRAVVANDRPPTSGQASRASNRRKEF